MDITSAGNPYRKIVSTAVAAAALNSGFRSVTHPALETVTEMAISFITELGRSSKVACELAGRTVPMANDVVYSLVEMGFPVRQLKKYADIVNDPNSGVKKILIPAPGTISEPQQPSLLHVDCPTTQAKKKRTQCNIPDHFPDFPDPHTYTWTPTYKQPVTDYLTIRDKAANQKRDMEKNLCKFVCKTGSTTNLYLEGDDNSVVVPVIATEATAQPYLRALLFKDQYFNEEVDENIEYPSKSRRKRKNTVNGSQSADNSFASDGEDAVVNHNHVSSPVKDHLDSEMENPFLRSPKMPMKASRG